jgi:hypothetical protein
VALNSITLILKPIKNLKKIRPCHMTLEIQVLVWDRHTCCRIKPVNEIPTLLPCDNWISHDNININKQEKQPTKI